MQLLVIAVTSFGGPSGACIAAHVWPLGLGPTGNGPWGRSLWRFAITAGIIARGIAEPGLADAVRRRGGHAPQVRDIR